MSWCESFWIHLVWDSLCLWDLDVCFFPRLGKFLAIMSNTFSVHFFLSFPSGTSIMQMLVHFMLSLGSVELSSSFNNSFLLFAVLFGDLHCLPGHRYVLLCHLAFCWSPPVFYSSLVFFSSVCSVWKFLLFSVLLWNFSLCSSLVLPSSVSILWPLL